MSPPSLITKYNNYDNNPSRPTGNHQSQAQLSTNHWTRERTMALNHGPHVQPRVAHVDAPDAIHGQHRRRRVRKRLHPIDVEGLGPTGRGKVMTAAQLTARNGGPRLDPRNCYQIANLELWAALTEWLRGCPFHWSPFFKFLSFIFVIMQVYDSSTVVSYPATGVDVTPDCNGQSELPTQRPWRFYSPLTCTVRQPGSIMFAKLERYKLQYLERYYVLEST